MRKQKNNTSVRQKKGTGNTSARREKGTNGKAVWQEKDVRGQLFFENPDLCAEFLRDYSGIEILKNVQPEDIEKVDLRYHLFDEVTHHSDAVKRIRLKSETQGQAPASLYIISLVDHKSKVDFNAPMQLLRYIVCIWADWEKEMSEKGLGHAETQGFRYPPILPIIYHEGKESWTADMHLSGRIAMADMFAQYIPDFTYRVVHSHDYSNEELLANGDTMSLLMMLSNVQTAGDIENLRNIPPERIDAIIQNASPAVIDILSRVIWSLCRKLNLPEGEAEDMVQHVKEGSMGYIFENLEKMDIQEERRQRQQAQQELKEAKEKAQQKLKETQEKARVEIDQVHREADQAHKEADQAHKEAQRSLIETCQQLGATKDFTVQQLCTKLSLKEEIAKSLVEQYWQ